MNSLPFGSTGLPFDRASIPNAEITFFGSPSADTPTRVPDSHAASRVVGDALECAVGGRLRDLARGAATAVILVPGIDRVAAVGSFVPPLLAELREAGVARTRVFLATGTHEHRGLDDLRALLGDEVLASIEPVIHDPRQRERDGFVELGTTTRGTPVDFARTVMESDVKILTGRVVPHYFAGFGGGRKALLPGAASLRTILANHRLTLAPETGIASGVGPCMREGNPVHLDMLEAARLARPTFSLSVLLDAEHRLVGAHAGDIELAHAAACDEARALHQLETDRTFDGVITSAGGAPYDCNFVQALKALFDVQTIVRPGGAILCLAECPQGIAKPFVDWTKTSDDDLEREVRGRYNLAGHNTIMLRALTRRAQVGFVSRLDREIVRALGLVPLESMAAGLSWLADRVGPRRAEIACVPYANVTHVRHVTNGAREAST